MATAACILSSHHDFTAWEIQDCRILRHRLLATYRQKAIESALSRNDMAEIAPERTNTTHVKTR
jgi:hypothetical protein